MSEKKIIVLQRGWVLVGDISQDGATCTVRNGAVVRIWGTSKGLGELAMKGPLKDTVLDPITVATFHELTKVFDLECSKAWDKVKL